MDATHSSTPTPWYVASTGTHQALIISEATGANVAVAYDAADAPLLAAAPALLDVLADIVDRWSTGDLADAVRRGAALLSDLESTTLTPEHLAAFFAVAQAHATRKD